MHRDVLEGLPPFPCGHRTSCGECAVRTIRCCTCWQLLLAITQRDACAFALVLATCNVRYVSETLYDGSLLVRLGKSPEGFTYADRSSNHTTLGYAAQVANAHGTEPGSLHIIAMLLGVGVDPTVMGWTTPRHSATYYQSVPLCMLAATRKHRLSVMAHFFRAGYNPLRHAFAHVDGKTLTWLENDLHVREGYVYMVKQMPPGHLNLTRPIWPDGWRHWQCSRAATALLGVGRRLRARGDTTCWTREVAWLLARALLETRFASEWECVGAEPAQKAIK